MNTNLRVTIGMGGCFSSEFLHYAVALGGLEPGNAVVAYAFIDRTPEVIGTASAADERRGFLCLPISHATIAGCRRISKIGSRCAARPRHALRPGVRLDPDRRATYAF